MKRKRNGRYTTTRAQYKEVKKFDHAQLDEFCTRIYLEGIKDGRASVPGTDLTAVMEQIKNVKGIGEKRLAQIEAAVGTLFTGKKRARGIRPTVALSPSTPGRTNHLSTAGNSGTRRRGFSASGWRNCRKAPSSQSQTS